MHDVPKKYVASVLDYCMKLRMLKKSKDMYEGYAITKFGFYAVGVLLREAIADERSEDSEERGDN
jgi:hypothetical protein